MKGQPLNLRLPEHTQDLDSQLDHYINMLLAWKKAINIIGANSRQEILTDLVQDCLYLASFMGQIYTAEWQGQCWDLGAGAGLPGIPLRMVWQNGEYTMIEAREKRALFLANALAHLKLPRTKIFRGTVENYLQQPEAYNGAGCIISRAFMPWQKLLPFCKNLLQKDGHVIVMANQNAPSAPDGWKISSVASYVHKTGLRYIWGFTPDP